MSNIQGKLNVYEDGYTMFMCPGCKSPHAIRALTGPKQANAWAWNGSYDKPTFQPSILVSSDRPEDRCHSFVTDGKIQFLSDCFHDLRNQTIEIPDWDEEKFWADD